MTKSKPVERDFNVFVGAETGILKGVSINPKANLAKNFHNLKALQKSDEITALNWNNEEKTELLLGLRNQTVKIFDLNDKMFIQSLDCSSEEDGSHGPIVGVCRASDSVLVTATRSGVVRVWKASDNPVLIKPIDYELECSGKLKRNQFEKEEEREKHLATLKAGRELVVMKHSRMSPNLIATGGKENDLQIWDLENLDKPTFRAKNVRPDFLELRVPVWITGIAYPDPTSHHLLSTSSRHGHIRLYDLRISGQRRPVRELEWPEAAITSMSATNDPNQVLVGTNVGELALFDFR